MILTLTPRTEACKGLGVHCKAIDRRDPRSMIGYLLIHCCLYNSESIVGPVGTLRRQVQLFRVTECTLFLLFKICFALLHGHSLQLPGATPHSPVSSASTSNSMCILPFYNARVLFRSKRSY